LGTRDSSVGIATTYIGVRVPEGLRDFSLPQKRLDRLWGPPSLLGVPSRG